MIGSKASSPKICQRCVLPDTFPGISFDAAGVCSVCNSVGSESHRATEKQKLRNALEEAIELHRGKGGYDCVVAFSGGKDSSATVQLLATEYRLRVLAVTIDNGFIAPQALANCSAVTRALGVDHLIYAPQAQFINRMYRESLVEPNLHSPAAIKRASSLCNSCINLINTYVMKVALQNDTALIAGGYVAGQVPKDAAVLSVDLALQAKMHAARLAQYERSFGSGTADFFQIPEHLLATARSTKISVINPLLTRTITEEELIAGLAPLGWIKPQNTGKHSSNCRINDLGIVAHLNRHGFHPYVFEVAEAVRDGTLSRAAALEKLNTVPAIAELQEQLSTIGLDPKRIGATTTEPTP